MNSIKLNKKDGSTEYMEIDEFARWACLVEAISTVGEKLDEAGVPADNGSWVKPLAFEKYIRERFHAMRADVIVEAAIGRI
tara:strand:+ start:1848 stop:2090 length:243 start_codon:yes stop_codon:yes gene_type:complete